MCVLVCTVVFRYAKYAFADMYTLLHMYIYTCIYGMSIYSDLATIGMLEFPPTEKLNNDVTNAGL